MLLKIIKWEILSSLLILFLISCGHKYIKNSELINEFEKRYYQRPDTLITVFSSCTECLDQFILQGKLTTPNDLKATLSNPQYYDIKVCGNFPFEYIDVGSINYDPGLAFKIVGKVIKADTNNAIGAVPLFYVSNWTKFNYDFKDWEEKNEFGLYTNRKKMIKDIIENFKFEGEYLGSIVQILGEPDLAENNSVTYRIEDSYVSEIYIKPKKELKIKFSVDSLITSKNLKIY
jgi:hypothetical protein